MARIRTIKPIFFRHEKLFEAEQRSGLPLRLAFIGLWTAADREGRFHWRPRELKLDCLPYDDADFSAILNQLQAMDIIQRYSINGEDFGCIPSWSKHQVINQREAQSAIPEPTSDRMVQAHARTVQATHIPVGVNIPGPLRQTVLARDGFQCVRCQSVDDLTVDHIFPQSIGGTHSLTNLRSLCRGCNSARPVQGKGLVDDLAIDGLTLDDMQRMCMHVQVRGEGKGREQEGKESSSAKRPSPSADFEILKRKYPKRLGDYKWALAERKFNSLVKTGVPASAILAAVDRLSETHRKLGNIGTQFVPMPASWLNSEDFTEAAADSFEEAAPALDWEGAIERYRKGYQWNAKYYGAEPGSPTCRAPADLLAKHGYGPVDSPNLPPPSLPRMQ